MRHGEKQANRVVEDARERLSDGRKVYSVIIELAEPRSGPTADLSDAIEEVEELGWRLDSMGSASTTTSGRPKVLLVFRPA
ncbi:hypothetical protein ACIO6U_03785 [Streptomyces sp. NPDC087422]|uniref:hypothetical protein n=1 Tax=Streptomyces sp. NPDC087422 TaxID=3365786 RepID=UPI003820BA9E